MDLYPVQGGAADVNDDGSATPMGIRVLIYVQLGSVPVYKQTQLCLQYVMAKGWSFSIVPAGAWREAVRLIREGQADVLLMAYHDENSAEIARAVEEAGGTVEFCRPGRAPEPRAPGHDTTEIVLRMHDRGGTTGEIVRLLGVAEGRVRAIVSRARRRR